MATKWQLVAAMSLAFGVGCGGHKSQPVAAGGDDTSGGGGGGDGDVSANPCDNGMCPPETLDRIKEVLDAKRLTVSRCLSDAVVAGQAPKNAKGAVSLSFVITPGGKATDVKVNKSSVGSKTVEDCVVGKVEQIAFPEVPKNLDWSYTYAFESN
jgi:hypothetical protein